MKKITLLMLTTFSMFTFGQAYKSFDTDRTVKQKPVTYKLPTKPVATLSDYYKEFNSQNMVAPKLYYQQDISMNNISSQQFEASLSTYNANAADDFEVPAATIWKIESVSVIGRTEVGSFPDSFNVTFYSNTGSNLPGTVIRTENITLATGASSPTLQLATPVLLTTGKYWVSVQAVMNITSGQWFWDTYSDATTLGAPFAWKNPGNGFATPCNTDWKTASICFAAQLKDLKFSLNGEAVTPCKTITGRILITDPTHFARIFRDGISSYCGTTKPWPGILSGGTSFHYKTYSVKNTSASAQCITFRLNNADTISNQVHLTAYSNTFNPADITQNYMGDTGSSSAVGITPPSMDITVPANATIILVASEVTANTTFIADYTIEVIAPDCAGVLKTISTAKEKMSLYPNPTKKTLFVNGMNVKQARVYDTSGKLIPVKNNANDVDVENLPKGTYLIQLEDKAGKVHSDKFIKN